ncbi:hypothetical protein CSOJ01_12445 [Colletotrichum sojae]|uniref:Uncharacterized protein n=1 Tax=Colletotrichum sojae TaxID=2175907 RepID=A0A8H6IVS3_9PEZI|nr:hypothetical protein CSOJ01_12445 [Colletotrichum sojae]
MEVDAVSHHDSGSYSLLSPQEGFLGVHWRARAVPLRRHQHCDAIPEWALEGPRAEVQMLVALALASQLRDKT